jgi:1,4-dihydroxy-2-naphthoate octaprenyltransferase
MGMGTILSGLLFGCVGMGYIMYGRKQSNGIALVSGILLCGFPYLVTNILLMFLIGAILMAAPFFIKL